MSKAPDTVTFDFPAIGQLIRNRAIIRQATTVQLVLNSDGLVPEILMRFFLVVARRVLGRDVAVIRLNILAFNDFGPAAVDAVETGMASKSDSLINAVAAVGQCDPESAARFIKRVMLEKVFVQQHILFEMGKRTASTLVITDLDFGGAYASRTSVVSETGLVVRLLLLLTTQAAPFLILLNRLRTYPPRIGRVLKDIRKFVIQNVRFEHDGAPGELWRFKRSNASTDYVYDRDTCALFITDQWTPPAEILSGYTSHLDAANVHYENHTDFRTTPMTLCWAAGRALAVATHAAMWSRNWFYLLISLRLCGCLFREKIHLDNLCAESILCFDDYSERHIVRTWLGRRYGTKTVGMAHSANNGLWATPQLAYILFDKYLIWNSFSQDLFSAHWPADMLVPYGYDRIDGIIASNPDIPLPSTSKKRILITLPGFRNFDDGCRTFPGLRDLVAAINQLDDNVLTKIEILIRPKQPAGWDALKPEISGDRVTPIIGDDHSTAEYMRAADLVICNDGSGILSECAVLRLPVVCFDFFKCDKKIWDRFGSQMYNAKSDDLDGIFTCVAEGKSPGVDFDSIWQDLSYPYVSDRTAQLRGIIEDISDHRTSNIKKKSMIKDLA